MGERMPYPADQVDLSAYGFDLPAGWPTADAALTDAYAAVLALIEQVLAVLDRIDVLADLFGGGPGLLI